MTADAIRLVPLNCYLTKVVGFHRAGLIINIKLQLCVRPSVRALRRVNGSQSTPSQKLVHPSTERHGGYGSDAVEGAHDSTTYE